MTQKTVYICGAGIISSLGAGLTATQDFLCENRSAIKPLELFSLQQGPPLPVGEVSDDFPDSIYPSILPRTHLLAMVAARQALQGSIHLPEAIILGTTTGGILTTEQLLRNGEQDKACYQYHGLNTVADCIARESHCSGPALVVSTACSSGVVAIALALKMLQSGSVSTVLAGGVDSLSRLTYFGFHSLQLVDRNGCKPLDLNRQGMAVAEGAGMLLLTTQKTACCHAELLGAGLSCDAYHPAAPHPEGQGAFMAMQAALVDAGLTPEDISYINLHGTGTPDNDLAESKAVRRLFPVPPPLSSIKGASGHSLAAAGAIEAIVSTIAVAHGMMPANTGLQTIDPQLGLTPLRSPLAGPVRAVLSNSFGFGGNNGSLVIGAHNTRRDQSGPEPSLPQKPAPGLAIHGYSFLTGAGTTQETIARIQSGQSPAGKSPLDSVSKNLPPRLIRRLKRLPRMTLSLAAEAYHDIHQDSPKPGSVFMGTGWGALSETYDFLTRLNDSKEEFPSPTDFVGSVHNGPASQVAIMFGATGPNITATGGDYSFEQALLAAELMYEDSIRPALILGADEGHDTFSPLLDASIPSGATLADGGGALCVNRETTGALCTIAIPFYQSSKMENVVAALIDKLGITPDKPQDYALLLVGIPKAMQAEGEKQLEQFISLTQLSTPVVHYRKLTGDFASASAVATALAVSFFASGKVPAPLTGGYDIKITNQTGKILVLGLGQCITAVELCKI